MAHFVFYDPPQEAEDEIAHLRWQMAGNRMMLAFYRFEVLFCKANFDPSQVTGWFMMPNDKYNGLSPREYLRGQDWAERAKVGREALVDVGLLKP